LASRAGSSELGATSVNERRTLLSTPTRKLSAIALTLLLLTALLQACGGGEESTQAVDPELAGPYPVGVTELTFERTSSTTDEPRLLKTLIWYPAADSAETAPEDPLLKGIVDADLTDDNLPLPVIMFSHGSGGTPSQSTYYTSHLASHGFVVVAPPHPGNTLEDCFPCTDAEGIVDSYLNRPHDVTFALESMLALNEDSNSIFHDALDGDRVGISGHSFGALDTLRMAAGDSRFLAALAMAPPAAQRIPLIDSQIEIPTMIMGGSLDTATPLEAQEEYFDSLGEEGLPHFLLIFLRGGHFAYSDICLPGFSGCEPGDLSQERAHQLINLYATAFLRTYVALEEGYEDYLEPEAAAGDPDIEYRAVLP
jgi:predicted dienelactone hydrolase